MISLLTVLFLAQTQIPSTMVPPTAERSIVFQHNGYTYFVGADTGKVSFLSPTPQPGPSPTPTPVPDEDDHPPVPPLPPPVSLNYKYAIVAYEKTDPVQSAWTSSEAIRDAVAAKNARVLYYASAESDITRRNILPYVTQHGGYPIVILQAADGKVLLSRKIDTEKDLLEVLK